MHIQRHQLRELQYLQEDIAEYFTDDNIISGETYWTCVESIAIAKLAELRGDIQTKIDFWFKKRWKKNSGPK